MVSTPTDVRSAENLQSHRRGSVRAVSEPSLLRFYFKPKHVFSPLGEPRSAASWSSFTLCSSRQRYLKEWRRSPNLINHVCCAAESLLKTSFDIRSLPKVHQPQGQKAGLCGELPTVQENYIPPPQATATKASLKGTADKQAWEQHPSMSPKQRVEDLQLPSEKKK